MKINRNSTAAFASIVTFAFLTMFNPAAIEAGEVVVNNFDDPNETTTWTWETWSSEALVEFDAQNASGGQAGSGSMRVINNFPNNPKGYSQAVVSVNLGGDVNAENLYTKIGLDVKVDPSSYTRVDGVNYGALEVIFRNGSDWTWNSLGAVQLNQTHTNWTHLEFKVKTPGDKVHHLTLKLGENYLTNTVIYSIDNIRWIESAVTVPPPTMAIIKTKAGLNLTAASTGQYDRQNIKTLGSNYGWYGTGASVSYSMTIKEFPSLANYAGFQAHMYLVPGTPGTEAYPDWTEPTVIYCQITANTNGQSIANFRYKTNAPNSNGQFFNADPANGMVGNLAALTNSEMTGTWTLTFKQDNNITITSPSGSSTNFTMPMEHAALFGGDVYAYFGIMPGLEKNIGQMALLSKIKITSGNTTLIDENFSKPLDTENTWIVNATSSIGAVVVTPTDPFWISWTTPSSGYVLQTNSTCTVTGWGDSTLKDTLVGDRKRVLVPTSALPSGTGGFFRLAKP